MIRAARQRREVQRGLSTSHTMDKTCSSFFSNVHHPRRFGVSATMRHGDGNSASRTGDDSPSRWPDGFSAMVATETDEAVESPNTRNDAKDADFVTLFSSARAAQPPRRGSESLVGCRRVRRRTSGARSAPYRCRCAASPHPPPAIGQHFAGLAVALLPRARERGPVAGRSQRFRGAA